MNHSNISSSYIQAKTFSPSLHVRGDGVKVGKAPAAIFNSAVIIVQSARGLWRRGGKAGAPYRCAHAPKGLWRLVSLALVHKGDCARASTALPSPFARLANRATFVYMPHVIAACIYLCSAIAPDARMLLLPHPTPRNNPNGPERMREGGRDKVDCGRDPACRPDLWRGSSILTAHLIS